MSKVRQILNLSYCRYYSVQQAKKKMPLISCKRPEYNHYEGQTYGKFEGVKLASQGWLHPKSKNDYFIIYGDANSNKEKEVFKKRFEEIGVCNELIEVMSHQGFSLPTAIQSKAIPSILKGHNTVITAETGCGKTLAYLLPIFQHILEWKPSLEEEFNSPLAVVITPSRELGEFLLNMHRDGRKEVVGCFQFSSMNFLATAYHTQTDRNQSEYTSNNSILYSF